MALLLLHLLWGTIVVATAGATETEKYWVFFTDKAEAAKSSESAAVSARTVQRRALRARQTARWEDLKVPRSYIAAVEAHGATLIHESRWLNAISIRASAEIIADISTMPFVADVRRVGQVSRRQPDLKDAPSEGIGKLGDHNFGASRPQLSFVNAIEPLEGDINGQGVRLGFLDTMFDFGHPALRHIQESGRLVEVRDFTLENQQQHGSNPGNFHGLNVLSIAAGFDPGNLIGPAYGAEVLAATTEFAPTETNLEEDNFVAGLEWLELEGVDVVNVSLGYSTFDPGETSYTTADMDGDTGITTIAADRAAALGVVMVVSAGNLGNDAWRIISTPADGDSVITVGAARLDSLRSSFSSLGPTADGRIKPDVTALGTSVRVASPGGGYASGSGTSFSSPMVAGIVCQMLQVNPTLNPADVLEILRSTSSRSSNPDNELGWGIVNARAAVDAARGTSAGDEPPLHVALAAVYPNPFAEAFTIDLDGGTGSASASLKLYDSLGRQIDVIFSGRLNPGTNRFTYRPRNLSSGVYFYVLQAGRKHTSGPLVHIR